LLVEHGNVLLLPLVQFATIVECGEPGGFRSSQAAVVTRGRSRLEKDIEDLGFRTILGRRRYMGPGSEQRVKVALVALAIIGIGRGLLIWLGQ
jgi:hypothetical protein